MLHPAHCAYVVGGAHACVSGVGERGSMLGIWEEEQTVRWVGLLVRHAVEGGCSIGAECRVIRTWREEEGRCSISHSSDIPSRDSRCNIPIETHP